MSSGAFVAIVAAISLIAFGGVFAFAYLAPDIDQNPWWQKFTSGFGEQSEASKAQPSKAELAKAAAMVAVKRSFKVCGDGSRITCVIDSDTFWLDGLKIKIADVDTPQVGEPGCASEAELGTRARQRLLELLNADPFDIRAWQGPDEDQLGRKLRVVMRDGRSVGEQLVSEGLARAWTGQKASWCS
ncbi:thermonuclease family protein [Rhizobium sp. ARZ01]|uniref:thermonuclease family protein n=1 Tax=Rhizobium sp. ARZ01 TaxID=2769313 RepID=UPI00177BEF4D|nr:thermonuclease family protein [Rhizobium sp. ARZ01]MBD9372003.1 thermonuclease family protein [Rhizobium sp. ARZ01]